MRQLVALTIETPPKMKEDKSARRCVLEFDDGTTEIIGATATDFGRLTSELYQLPYKTLPARFEVQIPEAPPEEPPKKKAKKK